MARLARVAVPGCCYHITHRGNRRGRVFVEADDRDVYRAFLQRYKNRYGMRVWAYCLMSNHVHLIAEPASERSLALAVGHGHGKYAQWFNARHGVSGHLWAGRFFSCALDDAHLLAAVRYVEQNPVRAGLVARAEDWPWSSGRTHCGLDSDSLVDNGGPFHGRIENWREWVNHTIAESHLVAIRLATQTGRPSGSEDFVRRFEERLNRLLQPQKPGPKPTVVDLLTEDMFG